MRSAGAWLAVLCGCSVFEMKPLAPGYDPRTIPRCEANSIYAVGDMFGAAAYAGMAVVSVLFEPEEPLTTDEQILITGGTSLLAVAHAASGIAGFRWSSRCDAAKEQWDQRQIEQDTLVQKDKARESPRAHYCASASNAGLCAREKADCMSARDAAIAAVPDMGECVLVETAHCFDVDGRERCFPIAELCAQRAGGVACDERR